LATIFLPVTENQPENGRDVGTENKKKNIRSSLRLKIFHG